MGLGSLLLCLLKAPFLVDSLRLLCVGKLLLSCSLLLHSGVVFIETILCVSYTRSFDYQTQTEDKAGSHAEFVCLFVLRKKLCAG
jgi:hypothetical protein